MSSFKVTSGRDGSRSFGGRYRGGNNRRGGTSGGDHERSVEYWASGEQKRGGGFKKKNRKRGGYFNPNRNGPNPRSRLYDEDEDMGGPSGPRPSSSRYNPYGSARGGRGRGGGGSRGLRSDQLNHMNEGVLKRLGLPVSGKDRKDSQQSGWWKITIPHGKKTDKDFILKSITEHITMPFVPYQFHLEGNNAVFHVNDSSAANAIRRASRQITTPTGHKMVLLSSQSSPPGSLLNKEVIDQLKVTMSKRYDIPQRHLDLQNLFNDPDFKSGGLHVAISKHTVAMAVQDVIGENIPELLSLNLTDNRLYSLDSFNVLFNKAPELTKLNISNNRLKSIEELKSLSKLSKLAELCLDKNPFCDRFSDDTSYIRAVRKFFPKIVKLDGHDLPPPITFDVEQPTVLPPVQGSYFTDDPNVRHIVCAFLEQYFALYDGDNRQGLLDAYHENVVFSMSTFYNRLIVNKQAGFEYMNESRNLLRVKDNLRKQKLLKSGKLNVVAHLTQLPKTQHDPASFVVDVTHAAPTLLSFTVQGVFKESYDRRTTLFRSFSRVFITVPQGQGLAIMNEEFTITNAGPAQMKKSFAGPAPTPSSSPVTQGPPSVSSQQQKEMVKQFCLQSGMNEEWSIKCLALNEWNYEKSAANFAEANSEGKIPPEAFVK